MSSWCRKNAAVTLALAVLFVLIAIPAGAQAPEPIRYTVSFPAPQTHYLEVEAAYPTEGRQQIDLMMAVWTPGSYLVREYSRHVESLTAADPARVPLAVEKTRKNRWRVTTNGARTVWVRYRVYAHEMSVRTNWVDEEFAMMNGAPTFITLLESPSRREHHVRVVLPRAWSKSFSGMPSGIAENTFVAADYDALVDSPIVAGTPSVYEFSVDGKPHYLVNFRERGVWNGPQAARDLAKIVQTISRFWGDVPFDRFYFLNVIGSAENGLEHRNSTLLNAPLDSTRSRNGYLEWLSLASHEYFHAWNGKRLRPIELGPFDYENEVYTRSLWFVEGVTDYYAPLFLRRSGVATQEEYLDSLSSEVRSLQTTPGRLVQSLEGASFDAWIKFYRVDENTPNSAISYYVKGAVFGFLLDAKIRKLTGGAKSLDDLMRLMRSRFSGAAGFSREDLRAAAADVVGPAHGRALREWMSRGLETTAELDYTEAIEWFGLRITPPSTAPRAFLGVATRVEDGKTLITGVRRGSPAAAAGLSLQDEIVLIDGTTLAPAQLPQRLERMSPGMKVRLSIARSGTNRDVEVVLGTDPAHGWQVSPVPGAAREQTQRLDAWLQ